MSCGCFLSRFFFSESEERNTKSKQNFAFVPLSEGRLSLHQLSWNFKLIGPSVMPNLSGMCQQELKIQS